MFYFGITLRDEGESRLSVLAQTDVADIWHRGGGAADPTLICLLLRCIVYHLISSSSLRSERSVNPLRNSETQRSVPSDRR